MSEWRNVKTNEPKLWWTGFIRDMYDGLDATYATAFHMGATKAGMSLNVKAVITNCKNCGAVLRSRECEYCKTRYA